MCTSWHGCIPLSSEPRQKQQLLTLSQMNLSKPAKLSDPLLIRLHQSSRPLKSIRRLTGDKTLRGARGEITNYPWSLLTLLISLLYQWDLAMAVPVKPGHLQSAAACLCYFNVSHLTHHLSPSGSAPVSRMADGSSLVTLQNKPKVWFGLSLRGAIPQKQSPMHGDHKCHECCIRTAEHVVKRFKFLQQELRGKN